MAFHRLTTPSYFGGLPGGYDLINTGGAIADGPKVGGPNAGTYFHAFGEDATSSNFNRPPNALAENCDHIDDLLHRDVVVMHKTADVLAGAPVASIVLPAGTYLGGAGYTNSALSRARLFSVRDNSDRPILDTSLNEVLITGLTLTGGDAIGGGFSTSTVTLNLSPSVPASVTYRTYYGVRENLATLDVDVLPSGRDFALIYGHIMMPTRAHAASAIAYAGGVNWVDATTNPAATVEAQLDKIVADLTDQSAIGGGAYKVGFHTEEGSWFETVAPSATTTVGAFLSKVDLAFLGVAVVSGFHVEVLTVRDPIIVDRELSLAQTSQPIASLTVTDTPSWVIGYSPTTGAAMVQASVAGTSVNKFLQLLNLPDGSAFTGVSVFAQGSHPLPSAPDRAKLKVFKQRTSTFVITALGEIVDDAAAYELPHSVPVTFAADTVDNGAFVYYLEYIGETGGSALVGLQVFGTHALVHQTTL